LPPSTAGPVAAWQHSILGQQVDESIAVQGGRVGRRRQGPDVFTGLRNQVCGNAIIQGARNEVGLAAIGFLDGPK
jgi:hypothetical protein